MFVSSIIATIGRETLGRAVDSVLQQRNDFEHEVIVVNDSGRPLPPAAWQQVERVKIMSSHRQERSVARNIGASAAKGKYLHFLDDDDWLCPDGLQQLKTVAMRTSGPWLYGGTQLVDRQGNELIQLRHRLEGDVALQVMAGEWIPIQSSIFEAAFFHACGGFDPLIPGAEDIDLTRRVALLAPIAGTDGIVACVGMGRDGSSTDTERSRLFMKIGRDKLLDYPNTFELLQVNARTGYWLGRLTRIYVTSMILNAWRLDVTKAVDRSIKFFKSLLLAGPSLVSPEYWNGLVRPYRNDTFMRGFESASLQSLNTEASSLSLHKNRTYERRR